jgi:hypothetical protein
MLRNKKNSIIPYYFIVFFLRAIEDCLLLTFCLTKKLQKVKAVADSRPTISLPAKQNKLASSDAQTEFCF